jgi:sigma-E factor negative regulatory protein RseC
MIIEQGIVDRVSGQKASVRVEKSSACASCQSRDSCRETSGRDMLIEVANDLGAGKGDRIEISIPAGSFLLLSILVYLLPVAALIGGAVLGGAVGGAFAINPTSTFASIAGGCLGMGIAFYALKRLDRSARAQRDLRPRMTRILLRSDSPNSKNDQD